MSNIKILHICSYYYGTKLYRNLIEKLIENDTENEVFAPCNYGFQYDGNENFLIKKPCFNKIDRLFFYYKYNKIYKVLLKSVDVKNYSIMHAHSLFSNGYIAYKIYKKYNIPYVVAVRNTDMNTFFKYAIHLRKLGIKILENASQIVFISHTYKDKMIEKYIPKDKKELIKSKSIVLPNAIDNCFFEHEGEPKNEKDKKSLNLVYTGRIDENKNLITTIKCCDKILKSKYDVTLNVIGEITSNRYKKIMNDYDFIHYYGPKKPKEIIDIYKKMDLFVMPSKHETFGLTYVEAMAQGLPIIYTKDEGFDQFFQPGEVGYPIVYNDYNEMAEKIEFILQNYANITKNCVKNSLKFNWDDISLQYIEIYKRILEECKTKTIVILSHVGFDNSPYCNYVQAHAKALAKQGYRVKVLAMIPWFPVFSYFQKYKRKFLSRIGNYKKQVQNIDGVEVIYKKILSISNVFYDSKINLNGIFYYHAIKKIFTPIYKNETIVMIDAHTFKVEGYVAYRLKKKYPSIKTTVTLHGTSFMRNVTTQNGIHQIQKIFQKVDYAICVSDKIKKQINALGVHNAKVIYNGINQYDLETIDKEKCLYNILFVGNLIKQKNCDIVIKAIHKILPEYKNIKLTIVGEGIEKKSLENLVKELKMTENVTFTGRISNDQVLSLMNQSYIFIMPSVSEGFGIVYPEAMSMGVIVIGTSGEGIDGFIKNEKNGFLVNPNVDEIAQLIKKIYQNQYNIEEIRNKAYHAAKELTWENNAKKYLE